MSQKVFNLVSKCIEGAEIIAVAVVTYFAPPMGPAINASILIAGTAAIEICKQFIK